jgi:hypothetical protein
LGTLPVQDGDLDKWLDNHLKAKAKAGAHANPGLDGHGTWVYPAGKTRM